MVIKDYIPYIRMDQPMIKGDRTKMQSLLKILDMDWPSMSGENTLIIDGESGDELEDVEDREADKHEKKRSRRRRKRKEHIRYRA